MLNQKVVNFIIMVAFVFCAIRETSHLVFSWSTRSAPTSVARLNHRELAQGLERMIARPQAYGAPAAAGVLGKPAAAPALTSRSIAGVRKASKPTGARKPAATKRQAKRRQDSKATGKEGKRRSSLVLVHAKARRPASAIPKAMSIAELQKLCAVQPRSCALEIEKQLETPGPRLRQLVVMLATLAGRSTPADREISRISLNELRKLALDPGEHLPINKLIEAYSRSSNDPYEAMETYTALLRAQPDSVDRGRLLHQIARVDPTRARALQPVVRQIEREIETDSE